jgi:glycosyltransferase involved in cell wall biosynthesis
MPVHNVRPYLDEAVESILSQTFSDFEFVILDDASTDGSRERLREWSARDPRIRLVESEKRLGPVGSSNRVASAAETPFVARMDADDISFPDRLSEEFALLRDHPDVGVVGSLCDIIDRSGRKIRGPETWRLSRRSVFVPFGHGTIMYRRDIFDRVGGYREECVYWEDQDLIVRMSAVSKVAVIPRALYCIRQSSTSTRVVSDQERLERALDRVYRASDELRHRKDYEALIREDCGAARKLDPRVFRALGSVRLWAGDRPRLLRRTLSRARLSFDLNTAIALVWTVWATTSPSSLRQFLLILLRTRNRLLSGSASSMRAVRWRPGAAPEAIDQNEARS